MESNQCDTVTREQFMKARMVNAIVHGALRESDALDDVAGPVPDLFDDKQFPSLGNPKDTSGPRETGLRPSETDHEMSASEDMHAKHTTQDNASSKAGKKDLADMNPEDVNRIQDLARRMLGSGMGLRCKRRQDGTPYDKIYLNPLSPFFQASCFQTKNGRFECPFADCE